MLHHHGIYTWQISGRVYAGRICFSIEEILCIGDVTLQVLEYFHSRKPAVFYGDLKPANIMMTDQKRLYLVDFGSAVFSYSASYKETKGTRGYAALNSCKER